MFVDAYLRAAITGIAHAAARDLGELERVLPPTSSDSCDPSPIDMVYDHGMLA